ncbi:partial Serine-aspartate repeat-containing protein F, partial [Anaerolineales bacterium]
MKRQLILFLFTLMLFVISTAYAASPPFWVGSVYNDSLATKVPNVMNFDWSSSGSGNAQGLAPAGKTLTIGQTFTFRYQSYLFALNAPNGSEVTFPGLNSSFEYTLVAQMQMVVTAYDATTKNYIFKTLPGGQFFIYHDSQRNADVTTGFGFDDGTLAVSGTIDADQFISLVFLSSTTAVGSSQLNGQVLAVDSTYLDPAPPIVSFRFESTVNFPPLDSTTSAYFAGRAGEGNLQTYTVLTNDLALKVDASSKFGVTTAPPEISVTKTCTDAPAYGQPITFSAKVKNTGIEPLNNITCTDDPPTTLTGVPTSLDPGQEVTVTGSYMPTSVPSTDTLTCSGIGATSGTTVTASSSATCTVILSTDLTVEKRCVAAPQPGAAIVFMATLTNSGNEPLIGITCTDDPNVPLTGVPIAQLDPGATATVTGSYVPTTSGSTDTITCSGTGILSKTVLTKSSSATCDIITHPCINVTKSCVDASAPGQPITFTGTVTNCGDVRLDEVFVVDDHGGTVLTIPSLAPGASASYSGSYVPTTSPSTNTVTASGTDAINNQNTVTAQASATCSVGCTGTIGDFIWLDANANGIQDGIETGLPGATVNIYDSTGTTLIPGQPTIITNASGAYQFTGLCKGTYVVKVVPPAGYTASPSFQGGDATKDSNGSPATVTLPADNSSDLNIDFGYYAPASIGDFVWNDTNKNGVQDTGEAGIANVTVRLFNCTTGALVATTTTDANGAYLFTNLAPGSYRVEFTAPMGYTFTTPNVGNDATDSDANAAGVTGCYDIVAGQTNLTVDAGLYQQMPSIDIEKYTNGDDADAAPGPMIPVGGSVEWKYVVTNTGNVELTGVAVTDNKLGAIICPKTVLAPLESMTCTKTGTAVMGQYTNMGTVNGTYGNTTVNDQDPSHYYGVKASIDIRKQAEGPDTRSFPAGSSVPFEIVVTNTGNVPLTNAKVTDQLVSDCNRTIGTLNPGQVYSYTCTAPMVLNGFTNTACTEGMAGAIMVTDCDDSTVTVTTSRIDVEKYISIDGKTWFDTSINDVLNVALCGTCEEEYDKEHCDYNHDNKCDERDVDHCKSNKYDCDKHDTEHGSSKRKHRCDDSSNKSYCEDKAEDAHERDHGDYNNDGKCDERDIDYCSSNKSTCDRHDADHHGTNRSFRCDDSSSKTYCESKKNEAYKSDKGRSDYNRDGKCDERDVTYCNTNKSSCDSYDRDRGNLKRRFRCDDSTSGGKCEDMAREEHDKDDGDYNNDGKCDERDIDYCKGSDEECIKHDKGHDNFTRSYRCDESSNKT